MLDPREVQARFGAFDATPLQRGGHA
jgi:hypothetical protein